MKLKLYAGQRKGSMKNAKVTIQGDLGSDELDAIGKCLGFLFGEGHTSIGYDRANAVFYFRGRKNLRKDLDDGFVLSLSDARKGACDTIFLPPSF